MENENSGHNLPLLYCIVFIDSWLYKNINRKFDPIDLGLDYKIQNANSNLNYNKMIIMLAYLMIAWISLLLIVDIWNSNSNLKCIENDNNVGVSCDCLYQICYQWVLFKIQNSNI